jgi:hypothetical protein
LTDVNELNLRASGGSLLLGSLDNPNKMPFSGVLTYLGVPSDQPPGGSGGRRVMIPVEVGEAALPSLIGMPVNLAASMDDHDTDAVIGVITEARIGEPSDKGTPIEISGHIFAKSFPEEAVAIKASQETLGFSYETAKTRLEAGVYNGETVAVAKTLVFTGAAILYKNAAAYQSTSLAAKGEGQVEELLRQILAEVAELKASLAEKKDEKPAEEAEVTASEEGEEKPAEEVAEQSEESAEEKPEEKPEEKAEEPEQGNEISAAIAQLTELVQSIKADVDGLKAQASVQASAEQPPQRRSVDAANLSAKFDKDEDSNVFASIDKRNLNVEQSLAEKLAAMQKQFAQK